MRIPPNKMLAMSINIKVTQLISLYFVATYHSCYRTRRNMLIYAFTKLPNSSMISIRVRLMQRMMVHLAKMSFIESRKCSCWLLIQHTQSVHHGSSTTKKTKKFYWQKHKTNIMVYSKNMLHPPIVHPCYIHPLVCSQISDMQMQIIYIKRTIWFTTKTYLIFN